MLNHNVVCAWLCWLLLLLSDIDPLFSLYTCEGDGSMFLLFPTFLDTLWTARVLRRNFTTERLRLVRGALKGWRPLAGITFDAGCDGGNREAQRGESY